MVTSGQTQRYIGILKILLQSLPCLNSGCKQLQKFGIYSLIYAHLFQIETGWWGWGDDAMLFAFQISVYAICINLHIFSHLTPHRINSMSQSSFFLNLLFILNLPILNGGASQVAQWQRIRLPMQETRFDPWVRKIPRGMKWQPTPVSLPGKSHGQRSVAGYSPRGCTSWTRLPENEHDIKW